jgi:hypothetical protein
MYSLFENATSVKTATAIFAAGAERSGDYLSGGDKRRGTLDERVICASKVYLEKMGNPGGDTPSPPTPDVPNPPTPDNPDEPTPEEIIHTVKIYNYNEGKWCDAIPKIYYKDKFHTVEPRLYSDDKWRQLG